MDVSVSWVDHEGHRGKDAEEKRRAFRGKFSVGADEVDVAVKNQSEQNSV